MEVLKEYTYDVIKKREMAIMNQYGLKILSSNWDDYGKQYPGVMESEQLSIEKLQELQKKAYEYNPKKKIQDFVAQHWE